MALLHGLDLSGLTPEAVLALPEQEQVALTWRLKWLTTARPAQVIPQGDWSEWGAQAGRGFGKTLLGAQWLGWEAWTDPQALPSAVIAPTQSDVRYVCFEGQAGLVNVIPDRLIADYNKSDLIITLVNGATIRGFSAEKANRLRGPEHARIWCFVAGTMVTTPRGDVPIERFATGDMVMTRNGPRRVAASTVRHGAPTGIVTFDTGASLVGTPDHPVYTPHGWTRLDRLREGDTVCAMAASLGAASGGINTPAATTSERTSGQFLGAPCTSTGLSGQRSTDPLQTSTTCTTSTRTEQTTASKTSNACRTQRIAPTILGANPSSERTGVLPRIWKSLAEIAVRSFSESARQPRLAVEAAVRPPPTESVRPPAPAGIAGLSSSADLDTIAASVVSTWRPLGVQSVYCLKVEGEPEYFANGILVHNCDEVAAWGPDGEEVYDMAMFGLRAGPNPQLLWTSTPKPNALIQMLTKPQKGRHLVRGSTNDNRANLPQKFLDSLDKYKGTQIYRQEVLGELLDPSEAGIIKRSWMRLWPADKPLPRLDWIIMSLDTAFTEATQDKKTGADPTACAVFGVFVHEGRQNVLLLDCWQDHLGLPDLVSRVKRELNVAYGDDQDAAIIKPLFGSSKMLTSGRKPDLLLIEDKGSGISLRQTLEREKIMAYAYNPGRADKLARLHMVSHVFARRQVWLPESAKLPGKPRTWVEPLLEQLCAFAGEGSIKHDDFVDATTQAIRLLLDKNLLNPIKAERQKRDDERDAGPPPAPRVNPYAA